VDAYKDIPDNHRAGFVNIIGRPNAGKSTLMNALVGEKLAIITRKAQTTRHRILGIVNGDDYQVVFSDTPGIINDPKYKLQETMMQQVQLAFRDADVFLIMIDLTDKFEFEIPWKKLEGIDVPKILVLNKTDAVDEERTFREVAKWKTDEIREKIFLNYRQEIPYSVDVYIENFKVEPHIIRIEAVIITNRKSQKPMLIGKNGSMLKKVGTEARKDIEAFLDKKVFLQLLVKVKENWRNDDLMLRRLGYKDK